MISERFFSFNVNCSIFFEETDSRIHARNFRQREFKITVCSSFAAEFCQECLAYTENFVSFVEPIALIIDRTVEEDRRDASSYKKSSELNEI